MKNSAMKRLITLAVVAGLVVGGGVVLNKYTGESLVESHKGLEVQSTLEMDEISLNSQIAGQINLLDIKEGDSVKKGQLIATVNSDTLMAQRDQAQAAIDTINGQIQAAQAQQSAAAATYKKVTNGARAEEIAQAKANYDLKKTNYDRVIKLNQSGAVSQADLDAVQTDFEVAKQKYLLAQNGATAEDKDIAKANLNASAGSLAALNGQLEKATAAKAEIETYIKKTQIIAPTDGVISQLNVDEGELVSTGLPIAIITNQSKPWVSCKVMEDELSKVKVGQKVAVKFQAYPDQTYTGTVKTINKSADFAVKRATNSNGEFDVVAYGVRIELDSVDQPLYAGMTVIVNFENKGK